MTYSFNKFSLERVIIKINVDGSETSYILLTLFRYIIVVELFNHLFILRNITRENFKTAKHGKCN